MDHFHEEVVIKRSTALQGFLYAFASVAMVVMGLYSLFDLQLLIVIITREGFSTKLIMDIVLLFMGIGGAVLLFLNRDKLKTEYEYTFTNGIIDFAQVFNNKKRKNLGSLNVKNTEEFGLVNSEDFRKLCSNKDIKHLNWFLNRENKLYYFYVNKDGAKKLIVLEASAELVGLIKKYMSFGKFKVN